MIGGISGAYWISQKAKVSFDRTGETLSQRGWESTISKNTDSSVASKNITATTAEGLLSDYLTTKKDSGGEALSADERAQIAADLAKKATEENTWKPAYVLGEVNLLEDSPEAYRTYANAVGSLFLTSAKNYPDNEATLMRQAFTSGDPVDFAKLSPNAAAYRILAKDLAKVPAPRSLANIHLRFMNDYTAIAQALMDIQNIPQDGMRGMVGITIYNEHLTDALRAGKDLADFFTKNNVTFSPQESGYFLTTKTGQGQ